MWLQAETWLGREPSRFIKLCIQKSCRCSVVAINKQAFYINCPLFSSIISFYCMYYSWFGTSIVSKWKNHHHVHHTVVDLPSFLQHTHYKRLLKQSPRQQYTLQSYFIRIVFVLFLIVKRHGIKGFIYIYFCTARLVVKPFCWRILLFQMVKFVRPFLFNFYMKLYSVRK